ncbi:MAG: MFS transporter [Thermomicrobiales bacterium]|nr:MFS transporter [Thermomicrobiales bacterium]
MEGSDAAPKSLTRESQGDSLPLEQAATQSTLRGLLRLEVLAICLVVFCADIMSGILTSTFSLYAENLGASVVFIGVLASINGLTGLLVSVPMGILSDRVGRVKILTLGLGSFSLAMFLMAIAPSPAFLIPGRFLLGIAMIGSFLIAAAHLGDIVSSAERGLAFGLLTTSMGLGFAVGPLLGGIVADHGGLSSAYLLAAGVGVFALVIIQGVLRRGPHGQSVGGRARVPLRESLQVGRQWSLVAIGIGNILTAIAFGGAVATIFPLRADALGFSAAAIGSMFSFRAIASTFIRLPSGALTTVIGTRGVVLGALVLEMMAVAGLGMTADERLLVVFLVIEGVGFGAFLASAQAYITDNTEAATRGAAIGIYSMTGGIGNTIAPILLGAIGAAMGLATVFYVSSLLVAVGIGAICWIWFVKPELSGVISFQVDD